MLRTLPTLSRRAAASLGRQTVLQRGSSSAAHVASPQAIPKTWGLPAEGPTFNPDYATEFRPSQIEGAGNGWWAKVDIPKGVKLRRVAVADGTLVRFGSLAEMEDAGWDIDDAVNYGIGHHRDPSSIYFLNPGTAMNHADKTRTASVHYVHDEPDVLELYAWTAVPFASLRDCPPRTCDLPHASSS